jgi:hypothetical protein
VRLVYADKQQQRAFVIPLLQKLSDDGEDVGLVKDFKFVGKLVGTLRD